VEKKPVKFLQKDDIPAGKVAKKSTPVKLKPGIAAKKGVEKKAVVGGVKRREVTTGRDVEQQVEEQQDLQQYRNVNQKEQVRQDTPRQDSQMLQQQTIPRQQQSEREQKAIVQQQYDRQAQEIDRQKSAFPEKAALSDKRKKGQARGSARGKSAEVAAQTAGIKPGPWSDFDRLNNELSQYKTYIPQDKIEDLFYTASNLAGKLENEFRGQGENCFAIDGAKLQELPGKKLLPVMNIESRQGIVFIMPHIRYFLEKSEPGTRAYRFFNLALSGWCDGRGCYGAIKGEIEKERRDELLSKWQALKPELRGIFLKMAGRTIHHLKK